LVDNLKDWNDLDLGTGKYVSCFPHGWKASSAIDRLNSLVTDGAILEATAEIPSGPLGLAVSSLFINHCTSSTVHRKSS